MFAGGGLQLIGGGCCAVSAGCSCEGGESKGQCALFDAFPRGKDSRLGHVASPVEGFEHFEHPYKKGVPTLAREVLANLSTL